MNHKTIITYSFLVFIYENKRAGFSDFSDVFIPLFKRTLGNMYAKNYRGGETLGEIKQQFDKDYGLNVPYSIMRKILLKIEREEQYKENQKFKIYQNDGFLLEDITFEDYQEEIDDNEKAIDELNEAYSKFLEIEGVAPSEFEDKSLFDFINENLIFLSSYFKSNTEEKTLEKVEEKRNIIQAKFIEHVKDSSFFITIKKIYLGALISSYLDNEYTMVKSDVELVFDTNFIVGIIGLSTKESYVSCKMLLDIAKKMKFKLSILTETIEETQNLLEQHKKYFDQSINFIPLTDESSIYASCKRQDFGIVDLDRKSKNLKRDLQAIGIMEVVHNLAKSAKFDENFRVFSEIRDNQESALRDTVATMYVKKQRKNINATKFTDINCWFVSNAKQKLAYRGTGQEIIRTEDLLNILWLSNPSISNTEQIINSTLLRSVSTTLHKNLPKNTTLQKISNNVNKYFKDGKIDGEEVAYIASSLAETTNKNFDTDKFLSLLKDSDKINLLHSTAEKQKLTEQKRIKTFNEFTENSKRETEIITLKTETKYQKIYDNQIEEKEKIISDKDQAILNLKQENKEKLDLLKTKIEGKAERIKHIIGILLLLFIISCISITWYKSDIWGAAKCFGVFTGFIFIVNIIYSVVKKTEFKLHIFFNEIEEFYKTKFSLEYDYDEQIHSKLIEELDR